MLLLPVQPPLLLQQQPSRSSSSWSSQDEQLRGGTLAILAPGEAFPAQSSVAISPSLSNVLTQVLEQTLSP